MDHCFVRLFRRLLRGSFWEPEPGGPKEDTLFWATKADE